MDTLQLIIDHGLTVRKIPERIVSRYSMRRVHEKDGLSPEDEIVSREVEEPFQQTARREMEKEEKSFPNRPKEIRTYFLQDGKVHRRFIQSTTVPNHAGWWMSKPSPTGTGSSDHWSKEDNLAPTLAESVAKCVATLNPQAAP